jgi:AraC family transcriptional regulator
MLDTPPRTMGLVYDDPEITAPAQCRYAAALEIPAGRAAVVPDGAPPSLTVRTLPAGTWACLTHVGGYDTIQRSYDALLGQALPRRGVELADEPTVEVSLNDPRTTPPHLLRTDIRVRLA